NVTTSYAYNADRQVTLITRPDGRTVSFGYDSAGRQHTMTIGRGTFTYNYNPTTGNLDSVVSPEGNTVTHTYDGNLTTSTIWTGSIAGTVNRTYDTDFRTASVAVVNGASATLGYDADSLLSSAGALTLTRDAASGL